MKQLEVKIMGQAYLLAEPEGGHERLLAAVQRVDAAMCQIRNAGKILDLPVARKQPHVGNHFQLILCCKLAPIDPFCYILI